MWLPEHENLFARLVFELGDLFVGVRAVDDAGGRGPWAGLIEGEGVRDDNLVDGVVAPGDFALGGWGVGVVGEGRPIAGEHLEGGPSQQQGVRGSEPVGVVGVEPLVEGQVQDVVPSPA